MITYKNLRNAKTSSYSKKSRYDITITDLIVDVYKVGGIFQWYKDKYIKTINLVKIQEISTAWRDLDNIHLPLDNIEKLEELLSEYKLLIAQQENEAYIIKVINQYKDNR